MKTQQAIDENFFWGEDFYSELWDLIDYFDRNEIWEEFQENESIKLYQATEEPIIVFNADIIAENLDSQRFSEHEDEKEFKIILKALNECIDFDKLNSMIPKLWYGGGIPYEMKISDLKQIKEENENTNH